MPNEVRLLTPAHGSEVVYHDGSIPSTSGLVNCDGRFGFDSQQIHHIMRSARCVTVSLVGRLRYLTEVLAKRNFNVSRRSIFLLTSDVESDINKLSRRNSWAISSFGRAPVLHSGGGEFESRIVHQVRRKEHFG